MVVKEILEGDFQVNFYSNGRFTLPKSYTSFFTRGERGGRIFFIHNQPAYQGGFKLSDFSLEESFKETPEIVNEAFSKLDTIWGFLPIDIPLKENFYSHPFPSVQVEEENIRKNRIVVLPENIRKGTRFGNKGLFYLVSMGRKFNIMTEDTYNQYSDILKLVKVDS